MKQKIKLIIVAVASALALLAAPANAFFFGFGEEPAAATVTITVTAPGAQDIVVPDDAETGVEMVIYCHQTGAPYGKNSKYPSGKPVVKGSEEEEALKNSAHRLVPCANFLEQ
ncbi:MAG: hypothetical protein ACR2P4_03400 [Gammaproteobacteria bacterium]